MSEQDAGAPVLYRSAVPGTPDGLCEMRFATVAEALAYARNDLRQGFRPLGVFERGEQVHDEAEIRRRVQDLFGEQE